MQFVDLFAGLGGFHVALAKLGHQCAFASEIDSDLRELYQRNFGIEASGDIRAANVADIPHHDILCAGFPCQPFSKAGDQDGLSCPQSGDLISYVVKILKYQRPKYFILENVPNLLKHSKGQTWRSIQKLLEMNGAYEVSAKVLSPHQFGVPQFRERVFIVGRKGGLQRFVWPSAKPSRQRTISSVLDKKTWRAKRLSNQVIDCLGVWQEFLANYPKDQPLPTFPIWSMEFGAAYPYTTTTPYAKQKERLPKKLKGNAKGDNIIDKRRSFAQLPSYARTKQSKFPKWKIEFIRKNRELYRDNKKWIDKWLPKIRAFPPSLQKLEWNANSGKRNIWKYVIQFRASGVRVKKATSAPSLVAMTTTQVPIIAWEKRYMTPRECARLQSLIGLRYLPKQSTKAFKALGNAVNAHLVWLIAKNLLVRKRRARRRVRKPELRKAHYRDRTNPRYRLMPKAA